MAQPIKYSLCKHGDLSWIVSIHVKEPDTEACGCTARAEEAEAGGSQASQSTGMI